MNTMKFTVGEDKKTLIVERTFAAPRSKVWAAYSQPELFAQWWGPRGWETEVKHMDFKEGGYLLYGMKCMDEAQGEWFGKVSWGKSTYTKIQPEELIEYTDAFCDEEGKVDSNMPEMLIKVEFYEEGEGTKLVSTTVFDSPEALQQVIEMGMQEGFTQTWDRLEEFVA